MSATLSLNSQHAINLVIADDMTAVNSVIRTKLQSNVPLISQIGEYIINAGGKRIRPMLAVLFAKAHGYQENGHPNSTHYLAAVIEFIHTATLLHDDVVDESSLRRGRKTANALFGNAASVLVGDFLYTRSFQMMVELKNRRIMDILAEATNIIAEGEVLQLLNMHNPDVTEERYLQVIRSKTAKLFEAATGLGALIAGADEQAIADAEEYGRSLGTAFQLIDDVLDYSGNAQDIGKNVGDDLREGKPTLPLIYLIKHGTDLQRNLVRECIEKGDNSKFNEILSAINESGAIGYTKTQAIQARGQAIKALERLPESEFKNALIQLAQFSVDRNH